MSTVACPCGNEFKANSGPWKRLSKSQAEPPISAGVTRSANGGQDHTPHTPPARCSCLGHTCTTLQRSPPWVPHQYAIRLCKGRVNPSVKKMHVIYCCSSYLTKKRPGRIYRSVHFHVCIQGHFRNESIEQSEYKIFMSLCILELKYIEGNKNNKALKKWQLR